MDDEERFRALLDERGILRADAALPAPSHAYRVFAQRDDARLEIDAWQRNAERFFDTTLGLGANKRYAIAYPRVDAARLVMPGGVRLVYGRPREEADLRDALRAESRVGFSGMYDLAERCATVWCVERRGDRDRVALLAAAVIASVLLGPILADVELFGVRTARAKLEGMG